MPVDAYGNRAQIVGGAIPVFNRMNPGQWYEQFINFLSELVRQRIATTMASDPNAWLECYHRIIDYWKDISPKWAQIGEEVHQDDYSKQHLVDEVIKEGLYVQITPGQANISTKLVLELSEKYNAKPTPVSFQVPRRDGSLRTFTTKDSVMIGETYVFLLYKIPHLRSAGVAYLSQYNAPVSPNTTLKLLALFQKTPTRLGEDENRYFQMTGGPEVTAHILGMYANSLPATNLLIDHLLNAKKPTVLNEIAMSISDIIQCNAITNMTKHMFSCVGIDIAPKVPATQFERILFNHGDNDE